MSTQGPIPGRQNFPADVAGAALASMKRGQIDKAIAGFRKIVDVDPHCFEAHYNLGVALAAEGLAGKAEESLRVALGIRQDSAVAYRSLGRVLAMQHRREETVAAFRRAVELKPDYVYAHCDLGVALMEAGRLEEAVAAFEMAIGLKPDFAPARTQHAMTLLLRGDFQRGWPEYEWRWGAEGFTTPRREFTQPMWDGREFGGRTLLLHAEQGYGDTIQFVRYAPMAAERGANVMLEVPAKLTRILRGFPGVAEIVPAGSALPPFDLHCPLMSLPGVFKTTLATVPASAQYLNAEENLVESWARRLGKTAGGPRVGIAWAGQRSYVGDYNRSMKLAALAPLAGVAGARFFSLQKGDAAEEARKPPPGMDLIDLGAELADFADTAAVIKLMDVIVSVDTAVAHLAGALGKPVWVMLPFLPDWRWLLQRADSPWYPSMRLFRQKRVGDWSGAVEDVARSLGSWRAMGVG
ncbi:MAG TPA: tetratricopeptide repeat-containing glycosyltransferase family protein [Tepidisphaeraceae bacterium]|nr:tetratricopeptide repeat-containing glycosyltransferase family protein [Tepidisphaeraceae bacterium]